METTKEIFDLTTVVKYCKDIMNKSNDMFADLKACIELDGYYCKTNKDVLEILVGRLQRLKPHNFTVTEMINLFSLGSEVKPKLSPEDLLLCHCISIIRFMDKNEYNYEDLK